MFVALKLTHCGPTASRWFVLRIWWCLLLSYAQNSCSRHISVVAAQYTEHCRSEPPAHADDRLRRSCFLIDGVHVPVDTIMRNLVCEGDLVTEQAIAT